jgi:hypothetical protein
LASIDSAKSLRIVPGAAFGGIGRAHHFAILRDGVLAFQHLHDDGSGGHELDQAHGKNGRAL